MTLDEAHLELLDHVGENVHVGIMLPGAVPWAGTYGMLDHGAHRMTELRGQGWEAAEALLRLKDWNGSFMVGEFVVPLGVERVVSARRTEGCEHPGIDFTVGTDGQPAVTVRVTFADQSSG